MTNSERQYLEQQLNTLLNNKHVLEQQVAQYGIDTPLYIRNQIIANDSQILLVQARINKLVPDKATYIDIWTREGANPYTPNAESLNWTGYFAKGAPSPTVWKRKILPDLKRVLQVCERNPTNNIVIHVKAHISAAIALGYTFSTTSKYRLWINQNGEWWHSHVSASGILPLSENIIQKEGDSYHTSIEVSLARNRNISMAVQRTIDKLKLNIGRRVQLSLLEVTNSDQPVQDTEHAKAIAAQIGRIVARECDTNPGQPIHLFAAVPVALAVLIGAHLNACKPIQCYEHRQDQGDYVPACMLT